MILPASMLCSNSVFRTVFFFIPIKYYQTYLQSTVRTIITLQYSRDEYPQGAKVHVYPKGINIDKEIKKKEKKLLKLKS